MRQSNYTSIKRFVRQLEPIHWGESDDWQLDEWFMWPPDIFALTSLLLSDTGAYRRAVYPPENIKNSAWPTPDWSSEAVEIAKAWRESIMKQTTLPKAIQEKRKILESLHELKIDALYESNTTDSWVLCKTLLELHGIADEAMRGIGFTCPRTIHQIENKEHPIANSLFYLQANILLSLRGSLSRIPKFRGIVLPKSRTPQIGLSLRSLSNHMTFHHSDVDIVWRAFPWINSNEDLLNIMIIPWPYKINATSFNPVIHPETRKNIGSHRFFKYSKYSKNEKKRISTAYLIDLIKDAKKEMNKVHFVVFPELALTKQELQHIKKSFEKELNPFDIPMIISGFSDGSDVEPHVNNRNRVILSMFYAEKWFDVIQDKHHRWRVDRNQVEQYQLSGVLGTGRAWWENIQIPRRKLSILAANSWLTICPLICEDLARLEPVSDLVRGIGPTLVTALLLDGPQIRERWPARYASVLADDPGSSVLTLTALGMSRRSRKKGSSSIPERTNAVALWKDQINGWQEIEVNEEKEGVPAVISVSAIWKTEITADSRLEEDNSAVLVYGNLFPLFTTQSPDEDVIQGNNDLHTRGDPMKDILDMCELTIYTFYIDAIIDEEDPENIENWISNIFDASNSSSVSNIGQSIAQMCRYSIITRDGIPKALPTPQLLFAIDEAKQIITRAHNKTITGTEDDQRAYWKQLMNDAKESLIDIIGIIKDYTQNQNSHTENEFSQLIIEYNNNSERIVRDFWTKRGSPSSDDYIHSMNLVEFSRIRIGVCLSIFWAIHVRLSTRRRYGFLQPEGAEIIRDIEEILKGENHDVGSFHKTFRAFSEKFAERVKV
jgi:hypothetical protein